MKTGTLLLIVVFAIASGGCALHYVPTPSPAFDVIPEFTTTNAVYLRNGQPSTDEVIWSNFDPRFTGYANLHEWTNVAISLAERELTKRGMTIADGESRSLTMAITSAKHEPVADGFGDQMTIVMHVEAGNGYSADYTGKNASYVMRKIPRLVDGAVMRVVAEVLKDPNIVSYLSK